MSTEIHRLLFELVADTDPYLPRVIWNQFSRFYGSLFYDEVITVTDLAVSQLLRLDCFSCVLTQDFLRYGVINYHKIRLPESKTLFYTENNQLKPYRIPLDTHIDAEALLISYGDQKSRVDINSITPQMLVGLFAMAREAAEWRDSIHYITELELRSVASITAKALEPSTPLPKDWTQFKFTQSNLSLLQQKILHLIYPKTKIAKTVSNYDLMAIESMFSFTSTGLWVFYAGEAEAADEFMHEYRNVELDQRFRRRLLRANLNNIFMIGLTKTICDKLRLPYSKHTTAISELMNSIPPSHRDTVITRRGATIARYDAAANNGCEHKTLTLRQLLEQRDDYFGEEVDNHIMCKKCNLVLLCKHLTGEFRDGIYTKRTMSLAFCKWCGEVLYEITADEQTNVVLDPIFRALLWERIQFCKQYLFLTRQSGYTRNVDTFIQNVIMHPLYNEYLRIEEMRTLQPHQKLHFHELLIDIYVLVAFAINKFEVKNVKSIDDLIQFIILNHSLQINTTGFTEKKIRDIIVSASSQVRTVVQLSNEVQVIDEALVLVNNNQFMQYALTGALRSRNMTVPVEKCHDFLESDSRADIYVKGIESLPAWFLPFARWAIGLDTEIQNSDAIWQAQREQMAVEVMRAGQRTKGQMITPTQTYQKYLLGPYNLVKGAKHNEQEVWKKVMDEGLGTRLIAINKESQEKSKEIAAKVVRELFIDRYYKVCPERADQTNQLHEFDTKGVCKYCQSTLSGIYEDNYFNKYKDRFLAIKVIRVQIEFQEPPPRSQTKLKETMGTFDELQKKIERLAGELAGFAKNDPNLFIHLGDLYDRRVKDSLELFRQGAEQRFSERRFTTIFNYLLLCYRLIKYTLNPPEYKMQGFYEEIKNIKVPTQSLETAAMQIHERIEKYSNPAGDFQFLTACVQYDCLQSLDDLCRIDNKFGLIVTKHVLHEDILTALPDLGKFIEDVVEEEEDAQEQFVSIQEKIATRDIFYQDFTYEADEDNQLHSD